MLEDLKELHAEATEIHAKFVKKCLDCDEYYANNAPTLEELADAVLYLRETFELMDEAKKKVNKLKSFVERLTCGRWLTQGTGEPIETDLCTARPKVRQVPNLPSFKSRPDDYHALCDFLGIKPGLGWIATETNKAGEDVAERGTVTFDWLAISALIEEQAAEGLPLIPGLHADNMADEFKVNVRRKRGTAL
jgi:hypothetical protein